MQEVEMTHAEKVAAYRMVKKDTLIKIYIDILKINKQQNNENT